VVVVNPRILLIVSKRYEEKYSLRPVK